MTADWKLFFQAALAGLGMAALFYIFTPADCRSYVAVFLATAAVVIAWQTRKEKK
jgi:hypothetical protein